MRVLFGFIIGALASAGWLAWKVPAVRTYIDGLFGNGK